MKTLILTAVLMSSTSAFAFINGVRDWMDCTFTSKSEGTRIEATLRTSAAGLQIREKHSQKMLIEGEQIHLDSQTLKFVSTGDNSKRRYLLILNTFGDSEGTLYFKDRVNGGEDSYDVSCRSQR